MKIGFFQVIGWVFILKAEIEKAYTDDQAISAKEMLVMFKNLTTKIDLPVDEKTQKALDLAGAVVDELLVITDDNKVSLEELVNLAVKVCEELGYDLDKTNLELPVIGIEGKKEG